MTLTEGKEQFIESWGRLAISWGENRTVGQVHALLLISCEPMCMNELMAELKISRGNVNETLRHLLDLGIIYKRAVPGNRKDYYVAEKDMWLVMKQVIKFRKKKELDPMMDILVKINAVSPQCEQSQEFCRTVSEIHDFSLKADSMLDKLSNSQMNWLLRSMVGMKR